MKRNGFTLIELMIVIAIIGILAGIATPVFSKARDRAREAKCFEYSSLLTRLCNQYNIEKRENPGDVKDLIPFVSGNKELKCPIFGAYGFLSPGSDIVNCSRHGYATASIGAD